MVSWNVMFRGRIIDIVFFQSDCDADYVYDSLVKHDGYDPRIFVVKTK